LEDGFGFSCLVFEFVSDFEFRISNLILGIYMTHPQTPRPRPAGEPAGPERLGEILSRLFAARGWGRRQERLRLEETWREVVGPQGADHTRVGALRRGVLEILVDNAVLRQELAHYQKRRLLEQLRSRLPEMNLTDLRFRAG
jgi:predicted nucleic acid-binding Zn ribbon protein